jgi:hypothetical protein
MRIYSYAADNNLHVNSVVYNNHGAALIVGRSPDRSPVVSLGIFFEASDKSMCPGLTQPFEMSNRIFLGVKTAGA